MRNALSWFLTHRRRMAPLVVLAAVVVVGPLFGDAMAQETLIRYRLGPDHEEIRALQLSYQVDQEEVRGVVFRWPEGAPATVDHRADLPSGRYAVVAHLRGLGEPRTLRRSLVVPAEGRVTLELIDSARASLP